MTLNELIMLSASSILACTIGCDHTFDNDSISGEDIGVAIKTAKRIWAEVLKQELED